MLREYLDRSSRGLWVRGELGDDSINLFWKPRYVANGSNVEVYDFNGELEFVSPASGVDWGAEWRFGGRIELTDEMAELSGVDDFLDFSFALMRHAVRLAICGYGDSPEDIVEMFSSFIDKKFIVEDRYDIVGDHGEFSGLNGCYVIVSKDENGLSGEIHMNTKNVFVVDLDDPGLFVSFVVASRLV